MNHGNPPYGMPFSYMSGLQTNASAYTGNSNSTFAPSFGSMSNFLIQNSQSMLTTASLRALRQQMEENNNELVNALTLQMGTVFNPLLRDTTNVYQTLNTQMERIANFFGAPPARNVQVLQIQNVRPIEIPVERPNVGIPGIQVQQPIVEQQMHEKVKRNLLLC